MRIELALFLAFLAFAMAVAHVVLTCRDRGGNVTSVTLLIAACRAVMLLRKLLPVR
jgi:hypothetical protein